MAVEFTATERAILAIVQRNLPATLTPYADIAKACNCTEEEVLALLQRLKQNGTIRRYGAMIRHHKTPWRHNAMVAWCVQEENLEACGKIAATLSNISHIYVRPSTYPEWPYNFYTMIHGRTPLECLNAIRHLQSTAPLGDHLVLQSLRELKKVSMTYF
ncbi:MAG: Lrp/AsnC family transcriptional regulator [Desulfovibrionaceae bacterium]|nr:Lrp/AsnC family transcriptional regulator [Desulfovibrionaceae bacterium]